MPAPRVEAHSSTGKGTDRRSRARRSRRRIYRALLFLAAASAFVVALLAGLKAFATVDMGDSELSAAWPWAILAAGGLLLSVVCVIGLIAIRSRRASPFGRAMDSDH